MNAPDGSLVIFQYEGFIVASAILNKIVKFDNKLDDIYSGAYDFEVDSIRTFAPITYDELKSIVPSLKAFSQTKQFIDTTHAQSLEKLIKNHQNPLSPDEVVDDENIFLEGSKKIIIVNSYERDYKARKKCIEHYGAICYACGFDFGKIYGGEYSGKINVHHVIPLSEIGECYKCNPIKDLRPVCPNCHLVLHTKIDDEYISIDKLRKRMKAKY